MKNLPVEVADDVIDDMFAVADTDNDGKLGYKVNLTVFLLLLISGLSVNALNLTVSGSGLVLVVVLRLT